jgi:hypothetical protein
MDQSLAPVTPTRAVASISTIEDLRHRRNFESPVDPKQHKLVEVLAQYSFAKLAPCGLSSCKQWHLHGFLVQTASGVETNIGHVCGRREFGQDFLVASAKFRREEERRVALSRLHALQTEAPRIVQQVRDLITQSFGVRWLFTVRDAVRARIGGPAFEHLKLRSIRNEYLITRVRELSDAEIRIAMDRTGRKREQLRYVNENLGRLAPMEWTRWDFKGQLLDRVRDEFQFLATLVPSHLETKELKKHLKRIEGWELRIRDAEGVLTETLRFLDSGNLRVVDIALEEYHRAASSTHPLSSLSEWAASQEYATLLRGAFRDGQALG